MSHGADTDLWKRLFYQPYAMMVPWAALVMGLLFAWAGLHSMVLDRYRAERSLLERERNEARQQWSHHAESRQARRDMALVLARLPAQRDFAPLALGLTEQAKTNGVRLPGLTYLVEKTDIQGVTKAVFTGPATGRYEDLRVFIHNLETAEELLLIENLEVDRTRQQDDAITITLRIVTYLRAEASPARS